MTGSDEWDDDDFFVEDEPMDDVVAAWREGEAGLTTGHRQPTARDLATIVRGVTILDGPAARIDIDASMWFVRDPEHVREPTMSSSSGTESTMREFAATA